MHFVYVLQSIKDKGFYIGYTNNLERRLEQHKKGVVDSTKDRRPLKLVKIHSEVRLPFYFRFTGNRQVAGNRSVWYSGWCSGGERNDTLTVWYR